MMTWLLLTLVAALVLVAVVRLSIRPPGRKCPEGSGLYPECLYIVSVSSNRIDVKPPKNGAMTSIALKDIRCVVLETNDSGPAGADVWWHVHGAASAPVCSYPGGATGEQRALAALQKLPGFDSAMVIQAMGSTSNNRFIVYERIAG